MSSGSVMPASGDGAGAWAVDTSVAVAYLDADHSAHAACVAAVPVGQAGLAGHAAFETYSVLTRLPGANIHPGDAAAALAAAFPAPCWLTIEQGADLYGRLPVVGIWGGAVYDALVGEAARVHGRTLLTRDRRAVRTYDVVGVHYEIVGP